MQLAGKVAIVTGAGGGGCGRALAQRFASEGAAVMVSDIDAAGGMETVRLVEQAGGRAVFQRADVAVEDQVRALIGCAEERFGGLDVLVNNAGPYWPEPLGHWAETIRADLMGPMFATLHAVEAMRRRGGGAIVNFGSTSSLGYGRKHSPAAAYDAAKAGVIRLTTCLGWLAERDRIRVNCIVPDWIATAEVQAYVDSLTPEQRRAGGVPDVLITLDEICGAVLRLAADEALAGRVMVWWCGQPARLIAAGDPGYAALEDFT
jgi:NAD(P)-dependent dehydrogenase (short-subunit alcohol dehydrogenase family)